ncbi:MAG: thioesterase family protein [Maritimibacter sp.]|nr:thioesterase family protein [Maritimibacter sp.]
MPTDLDINLHMTNSRYFAFMDLGRMDLILRCGLGPALRRDGWAPVIGGCMVQFRRPLAPFERFELTTEVKGCDEKWLYIEHRFSSARGLACVASVRGAFLRRGAIVPPELVAARGGFRDHVGAVPDNLTAAWQGFRAAAE